MKGGGAMKKHGVLKMLALLMPLTFFLMSCGGGGGGSSSSGTSTPSGSGSVAVVLADGPSDEYDKIYIWVTGVSLIPAEGNEAPVTIFETDQSEDGHPGVRVDLLEFRDEDFVMTVKDGVPAGKYSKIRLEISAIETIGGPCDDNWIKLPSGKIDLKPREPFYLHDGGNISIRLDIDADKSINLHEAGNSGKCIFRPVVFVDIEEGAPFRRCPKMVNGTIVELIKGQSGTEAFIIDLDRYRGRLKVELSESTAIFDEEGVFTDPSALKVEQKVKIRGKLADHGVLLASLVIIGELVDLSGEVESTVDASNIFLLAPFSGQVITDPQVKVGIQSQTLILLGCDTSGTSEMIVPGMKARVFGKYGNNILSAVTVILEERKISGTISSLQDQDSGRLAIIEEVNNGPVEVFIPDDTPIFLLGGKQLSLGDLCIGQEVRVSLDPTVPDPLTARVVFVKPEKHVGEVVSIDYDQRIIVIDEDRDPVTTGDQRKVYVPIGSKILKSEDDDEEQKEFRSFNDIEVKDYIVLFGLTDCNDSSVFKAFFIVIADEFDDDSDDYYDSDHDDYLPRFVLDNDVHIYLREGYLGQSLTVRGNNFSLTGQPGTMECDGDGWTSIGGDVDVYGNSAKFTNIKFLGTVRVQGNGAEFIDCCFKDGGPIHSN
jgi:hypothetical protein